MGSPRQSEVLRRSGKLSYTHVRELVQERLQEVGLKAEAYGIAFEQGEPQQQLTMGYWTDQHSNIMGDGNRRQKKMAILETRWSTTCQYPRTWACEIGQKAGF